MKHWLLFVLLFFSVSCARVHYTPQTDRQNDNLNGEVRVLREYFYDVFRKDNFKAGISDSTIIHYNRAGNISEQDIVYNIDGNAIGQYIAQYRNAGIGREVFVYSDSSGLLISRNTLNITGDKYIEITNYYYNSDGTLAERRIRTGEGERVHRFSYVIDKRKISVKIIRGNETMTNRYNGRGHLVSTTETIKLRDGRDSTVFTANYRYRLGTLNKLYDSFGRYEKYNKRGDPVLSVNMNLKDKKSRKALTFYIDYEYDKYGNWTYRYVRYSNEPVSITLREYEYY